METSKRHTLSSSLRLELLRVLITQDQINQLIEKLDPFELFAVHRFIWEKTIEFGIKIKGKSFPQEEINGRLKLIAKQHNEKKCPAALKSCNPIDCIKKCHDCARSIASKQIMTMCQMTKEFFQNN